VNQLSEDATTLESNVIDFEKELLFNSPSLLATIALQIFALGLQKAYSSNVGTPS
jgi:hypothetical protein